MRTPASSTETMPQPLPLSSQLPQHGLRRLRQHLARRCLVQHAGRHLLDHLPRGDGHVNVLTVDVVPCAADEEEDVVREVERRGDEGEAEEEEEDGVYFFGRRKSAEYFFDMALIQ